MSNAQTVVGSVVFGAAAPPKREQIIELANKMEAQRDKARLDFLGDYNQLFHYKIHANGGVRITEPFYGEFKNLRAAIDYLIDHHEKQRRRS